MQERGRAVQLDIVVDPLDHVRWQDRAACHGMESTFDFTRFSGEINDSNKENRAILRQEIREKSAVAEPICFRCPVFNECWIDAYNTIPVCVYQAGAALTSGVEAQRKFRLEESLEKRQRWIRNQQIKEWREKRVENNFGIAEA